MRRRSGLVDTVGPHQRRPRPQVLVLSRFRPGEHGCDAGVGTGEYRGPLIAGLVRKPLREDPVHVGKRRRFASPPSVQSTATTVPLYGAQEPWYRPAEIMTTPVSRSFSPSG